MKMKKNRSTSRHIFREIAWKNAHEDGSSNSSTNLLIPKLRFGVSADEFGKYPNSTITSSDSTTSALTVGKSSPESTASHLGSLSEDMTSSIVALGEALRSLLVMACYIHFKFCVASEMNDQFRDIHDESTLIRCKSMFDETLASPNTAGVELVNLATTLVQKVHKMQNEKMQTAHEVFQMEKILRQTCAKLFNEKEELKKLNTYHECEAARLKEEVITLNSSPSNHFNKNLSDKMSYVVSVVKTATAAEELERLLVELRREASSLEPDAVRSQRFKSNIVSEHLISGKFAQWKKELKSLKGQDALHRCNSILDILKGADSQFEVV